MEIITLHESNFDSLNSIDSLREILPNLDDFEITFDFPITKIPEELFYCADLVRITLPQSVTQIGKHAFDACTKLVEINIPSLITKIDIGAFSNCYSLKEITLPDSIETINRYAFYCCKSLTNITIPQSIKCLGNNIFNYCTFLEKITIQLSKEDFLKNVEGAQNFFDSYKEKIVFENLKSIDTLLSKSNSIESIMTNLDER